MATAPPRRGRGSAGLPLIPRGSRCLIHGIVGLACLVVGLAATKLPRRKGATVLLHEEFSEERSMSPELKWLTQPERWSTAVSSRSLRGVLDGDRGLRVHMDKGTDFWRHSYYDPPFVHDNGHVLYAETARDVVVSTEFVLEPHNQFDQCGLVLRVDSEHWVKVGIEYADGVARLGAVVTNNHSQWSTQPWGVERTSLRLYRIGPSVVAEAKRAADAGWSFFFIGHVDNARAAPVKVGLHAAAPIETGGSCWFAGLLVEECPPGEPCYHHHSPPAGGEL